LAIKLFLPWQTIETAHRVLNHCHRVFRYVLAHGLMEYDPSPAVVDALPPIKVKHRAAITGPRQVRAFMAAALWPCLQASLSAVVYGGIRLFCICGMLSSCVGRGWLRRKFLKLLHKMRLFSVWGG